MPIVRFDGDAYVLVTPQLAGIPRNALGRPAGSLAEQRDTIMAAMDFLLLGF
jgi:toxin CcdB